MASGRNRDVMTLFASDGDAASSLCARGDPGGQTTVASGAPRTRTNENARLAEPGAFSMTVGCPSGQLSRPAADLGKAVAQEALAPGARRLLAQDGLGGGHRGRDRRVADLDQRLLLGGGDLVLGGLGAARHEGVQPLFGLVGHALGFLAGCRDDGLGLLLGVGALLLEFAQQRLGVATQAPGLVELGGMTLRRACSRARTMGGGTPCNAQQPDTRESRAPAEVGGARL